MTNEKIKNDKVLEGQDAPTEEEALKGNDVEEEEESESSNFKKIPAEHFFKNDKDIKVTQKVKKQDQETTKKEPEKEKDSLLKKEITIKLNPRNVAKVGIIALLIIIAFFVGRLSVADIDSSDTSFNFSKLVPSFLKSSSNDGANGAAVSDIDSTDTNENTSTTSDDSANNASEETSDTTAEDTTVEDTTVEDESTTDTEETATTTDDDETVVTTYNNVDFSVKNVGIDWKGTWGKITRLDYRIQNTESGIIKPEYITMILEGYDDYEKKITLPLSSRTIKSGIIISTSVAVVYSYSETETGDLATVTATFSLYDAGDKLIDTYVGSFNLQG